MKGREYCYKKQLFKNHSFDVPVISVGNLTMGGSGKTPMVIFLAGLFKEKGFKPAVISRGYRGKAKKKINMVSDFDAVYLNAAEAGDEPYMIAVNLPGVPVITGKKRFLGCEYAIDKLGCDLILLDDGFQHLSVKRSLDLVLFPCSELHQNYHVFPGGVLREPFSALERCDAFVFTGYHQKFNKSVQTFTRFIKRCGIEKPSIFSSYGAAKLRKVDGDRLMSDAKDFGKSFYGFCGIANPGRFKISLTENCFFLRGYHEFPNHHFYSPEDIGFLHNQAEKTKSTAFITTEKDIVKLMGKAVDLPLYCLSYQYQLEQSGIRFIENKVKQFCHE